WWYPARIVQAWEQARLNQQGGEPVHQRHRQLTHAEQKNEGEKNEPPFLHSEGLRPLHETECAQHRDQENSAQIKRERKTPNASFDNGVPRPSRMNRALQQRQTFIDYVKADMLGPTFASLLPGTFFRKLDCLARHVRFRVIALLRERLDHMAIAVARRKIHVTVNVGRI